MSNKITIKLETENGIVIEYPKTTFDQVIDEVTNETLQEKIEDIELNHARNFLVNPLDLATEVTGVLPKSNYELPSATDVQFDNSTSSLEATNVADALKELFLYADSGKQFGATIGFPYSDSFQTMIDKYGVLFDEIIQMLQLRGVDTSDVEYLNSIPEKIGEVATEIVTNEINKISKLNVTAPYTIQVPLQKYINPEYITTSLVEYVVGTQKQLQYSLNFNNTDKNDFEENLALSFDGVMKIGNTLPFEMIEDETWNSEGSLFRYTINRSEWSIIDDLKVHN